MPTKNFAAKVKATAADDASLDEGQFTALASVFGNVDAVGDVVMPGAFADDLSEWKASGDTIPLYWGHRMDDPKMCVGSILDAQETDVGLEVKAQLDLDTDNGAQVYRLMKGRRVNRMSFAYDILDAAPAERDGKSVYELRQLKLHEISVVQVPANPAAVVQDVKRKRALAKAAIEDVQLAAMLGQADQAVDDASEALETADAALDAIMAYLGLVDADAAEEATEGAGQAGRGTRAKSGRTLSAKNEKRVRDIARLAQELLDSVESGDQQDGKASSTEPAATEEPDGAKVDAPARSAPADFRLRADLDALDVEVFSLVN